jgi:hypothetical protein
LPCVPIPWTPPLTAVILPFRIPMVIHDADNAPSE